MVLLKFHRLLLQLAFASWPTDFFSMPARKLLKLTGVCEGQKLTKQVAIDDEMSTPGKIRRAWKLRLRSQPSSSEAKSWRYGLNGSHLTSTARALGGKRKAAWESAEVRSIKMSALKRQVEIITGLRT